MRFILRSGYAGLFTLDTWKRSTNLTVNEGFKTAEYPLYEAVFTFHLIGQKLGKTDVENPDLTQAEPPSVRIMSAVGYEGTQRSGKNARPTNNLNVANVHGANVWAWTEFVKLMSACNADLKSQGKAKPLPGGIKPVAFRVDALEGKAQWEAKNVVRAWAPDMEQFIREDNAAAMALESAVANVRDGGSRQGGQDEHSEGLFSLSDDESTGTPPMSMSLHDDSEHDAKPAEPAHVETTPATPTQTPATPATTTPTTTEKRNARR